MDSEHGRASTRYDNACPEHRKTDILGTVNVDMPNLPKPEFGPKTVEGTSRSSSSSSSSTSSEEDFFQINTSELGMPMTMLDEIPRNSLQSPLHVENTQLEAGTGFASKHEVKDGEQHESMIAGPLRSGKPPIGPPFPSHDSYGSPGSDNFGSVGTKQSPPIQLMGRSDVPDPNRIPASIFARVKSTTPMEWSVASNESLFSIQMGKSGDLTSLYGSQFDGYPPLICPLAATSPARSVGTGPSVRQTFDSQAANAKAMKVIQNTNTEGYAETDKPSTDVVRLSDSTSQVSDGGSVKSYRSFAFPILTPKERNALSEGESVHQPSQEEQLQQPPPQTEVTEPPKVEDEPPKAEPVVAQKKWLPFFSCCSFCR